MSLQCPLNVMILLHHYFSAEPYSNRSKASDEGHSLLIKEGLIVRSRDNSLGDFVVTEKGKVHVESIVSLPFPVASWKPAHKVD